MKTPCLPSRAGGIAPSLPTTDPPLTPPYQGGEPATPPSPRRRGGQGGEVTLWTSSKEDLHNLIEWGEDYYTDYFINRPQWQNNLSQRLETLSGILHLDEILHNLRKNFPTCEKLILIPHVFLHLFPIHALPVTPQPSVRAGSPALTPTPPDLGEPAPTPTHPPSPSGRGDGGEGKPLQDLFAQGVTYAPNCQLLQQAQNRPRPNFNHLFAIQNPTNDLLFADVEVETISQSFHQTTILPRETATKETLLNQNFSNIHHLYFSCHGGFNATSPLDSGLLLANHEILTLAEIISTFNLSQCSLVTLSACETGQVALDTTDEYISLSSGFLLAGSPSIIASQWSVNQVSTALVLIKTYELLEQHPGQLAISLKAAQNWLRTTTVQGFHQWTQTSTLLNKAPLWQTILQAIFQEMGENKDNEKDSGWHSQPYRSPFHWAGFCIVGEGEQNMATPAEKIQVFRDLIENNPDLFTDYWQNLTELQAQLTNSDETDAEMVEAWLKDPNRASVYKNYLVKLMQAAKGDKGIGHSKAKAKQTSPSLKVTIENAAKNNTKLPAAEESPSEETPFTPES
ncbi:CHAT domain-containing protein [Roseofilum capinflatum]|uniref:CHAT domain-containing protein n=1 Tax=Roseofilum capinflatum BLCC-M114 TaxID=3022440 RepID=A0ABT7B7Y4_9CYAN|nr:CHAT domain-containing protein [Roseofilum capinflatum]MDJ1175289.1 CHAT domain-containing protein [Roseofilum capinflatum BLCC-M114]